MNHTTMDKENRTSSSEDSPEHSSTNKTVQKKDFDGKSCLDSDEVNPHNGLSVKKQKASSSVLIRMDDQLKHFTSQSNGGDVDNVSSENVQKSYQDPQLFTNDHKRTDEEIEKISKNLEKFLKEREPLKEVQLRKKTETSRLVRSDGEMAKIIEYCGELLKLSQTTSNTKRSSAPPTFNNETASKQKIQNEKLFCFDSSKISKEVSQTSDVLRKDAVGTEASSPTRALDLRVRKISAFKVPISPNDKTPSKTAKVVPTGSNEDQNITPVQRRPTHFNIRPRKAFYTFSPGSSPGVLRQCQSLPEINRPRRKNEVQRRSINFGEHSRIVRFLFKDDPEPATPESKVSTFYKSIELVDKPQSTENASEGEVKTLQNIPSKTCRKLDFGSCSKKIAKKNLNAAVEEVSLITNAPKGTSADNDSQVKVRNSLQNRPSNTCNTQNFGSSSNETTDKSQQTEISCDGESPSKRKIASPADAECTISIKKVRTSLETKVEESGSCENEKKNESTVDAKCSVFDNEVRTSSETRLEVDGGSGENVKLLNVGCSISVEEKKTSPGIKSERSVENVSKNKSTIDRECSLSDKVKTSSEIIVEVGSGENVRKHDSPLDVISAKKARTSSETKIVEN